MVLSPEECATVADSVLALSDNWVQRAPFDFYTLGAATYLDGPWDGENYISERCSTRSLLMNNFFDLYQTIINVFQPVLGAVDFHPQLGLPGFHIFSAKPGNTMMNTTSVCAKAGGNIHQDFQYHAHNTLWRNYNKIDFDHPLSFTIPIAMPDKGSGLNIWKGLHRGEHTAQELSDLARLIPPEEINYRLGKMIWFDYNLLHQIAPQECLQDQDRRITLQGHGLRCDDVWVLYF